MDWLRRGADGDGLEFVRGVVGCSGCGFEGGADEGFGFGEGESGGCVLVGLWGSLMMAVGIAIGLLEKLAYLTTLMAFGTKRWPLEGAIIVVNLSWFLLFMRRERR